MTGRRRGPRITIDLEGFDWNEGNRAKCQKHGVSIEEIEEAAMNMATRSDPAHSAEEQRYFGIGPTADGRYVFLAFTLRTIDGNPHLRPISARYMHAKEIEKYERQNEG